jgi:peptidyl-prolyl cis-trans isomerase B (cyclophilin B)
MRKALVYLMLFLFTTLSFATEKKMSDTQTKVKLTTSLGAIVIQLNNEKAPISAANFATYVKEGFYNGTIFHRVIPGFMAQGGGFDTGFNQKSTNQTIQNEADNGLKTPVAASQWRVPTPHTQPAHSFLSTTKTTAF